MKTFTLRYNPHNGYTCPDQTIQATADRLIEDAVAGHGFPYIGSSVLFEAIGKRWDEKNGILYLEF